MKKVFWIWFAILLFCSLCERAVQAQTNEYAVEFNMGGLYTPTRIVVQFVYSQNFSGPLNMRTLSGKSLWTAQISPVSFEFNARDTDVYNFDIHLMYNTTMQQTIQISCWSGTLAPNSQLYLIKEKDLWIKFNLTLVPQPDFPTKEEVAAQVVLQVKQDLSDYMSQIYALTSSFEENIMIMWAIIGGSILTSILSLVVAFYAVRSSHQERRR